MAAVITSIVGEVASLLGGTGAGAAIGRGFVGGVAGVGAADLLTAIQHDLVGGGQAAASATKLAPKYAIVDLHGNKIVKPLSTHRVYVILTHKSRPSRARRERVKIVPAGSEVVTIR